MAREFIVSGSGGRNAWRALKQAVVESLQPVAPRHHHHCYRGGNAQQQQQKIWSGGASSASASLAKARDSATSSTAGGGGWRDFVANRTSNYSEGLSSLLSPLLSCRRPDATMMQRSAVVVRNRCIQLISDGAGACAGRGASTALSCGGVGKVHYHSSRSVLRSPSAAAASSLVKRQMEVQSRLVSLMATSSSATARRNFSSSSSGATTWTQRWNTLRKAVSPTKQGGAASVGLKSGGQGRQILSDVTSPVRKTFSHYREAVGLQIEAFWKRNYLVVVGLVGLGVCLLLWRLMFGIASTFISMSEGLAKFGFLALAAAMVIVGVRFTANRPRPHVN